MDSEKNFPSDGDKTFPDYGRPLGYRELMGYVERLAQRYPFLCVGTLGTSVLGRPIPLLTLGNENAERALLYVGAHHGMEWITATLLLRFVNEFCEYFRTDRQMYTINMSYLWNARTILVVPMLNVDGCDLAVHGLAPDHPLRESLLAMNGGSEDFHRWQANARGVDLNHNYDAGFAEYKQLEAQRGIQAGATLFSGEEAESEPESGSLANLLRFNERIRMILTLHTQGEEIYFTSGGKTAPRSRQIARLLGKMSGYRLSEPEGTACWGGLTDWCIQALARPSFTLECGFGYNPLPAEQSFSIYIALRELLFSAPLLT